jgi:hypothetical protein
MSPTLAHSCCRVVLSVSWMMRLSASIWASLELTYVHNMVT